MPVIASAAMIALGMTARDVFWLSLIPGTATLIVILLFVQERATGAGSEFRPLEGLRSVLIADFSRLLLVVGLFSLGAFNFSFVLLNVGEFGVSPPSFPSSTQS